jgi:hypothetical protein
MGSHAELADLELPDFGQPTLEPVIPADTYRHRIDKLHTRAREEGYDAFVVYADREHSANLAYLTGFDARFEEALLVLDVDTRGSKRPVLLVGNEGIGYVGISPVKDDLDPILYQSFSLMGQERGESRELSEILRSSGVDRGDRVGVAGWKYFSPVETDAPGSRLEIPSYIVDTLRILCGDDGLVRNANTVFMHSTLGLRVENDVDQLARFEFAATYTSQAVREVIFGLRPGMSEFEAVGLMKLNGLPLSCHLMLSSGPRAFMGLPSPSSRRIERGDPFTVAYGVWGALNCRAGFVVDDAGELPAGFSDYVDKLVAPYFEAVASWYGHVGIGVPGGELYKAIHDRIGDPFFGVSLNPGHLIHLEEWVNSPVYEGSTERLRSGMAMQVDVIPATNTPYFTTNIEDGIALADEGLRTEFAEKYPEAWGRIGARREFMEEGLGIDLRPEVMPFSNIPGYLPPYLLAPQRAMKIVPD